MSHITTVEVTITDLEAVKALCREKGWEFREGQKTCRFWQGAQHPVDHAIHIPGAYDGAEIGLVKNQGKAGYSVAYDPICFDKEIIGEKAGKFMQGYGICKTEMEAKRRGLHVRRVQGRAGAVKLVLSGGAL